MREQKRGGKKLKIDGSKECDTLVLGSLIRGLKKLGLWPIPGCLHEVHMSVKAIIDGLLNLHCFALSGKSGCASSHDNCKFTKGLSVVLKDFQQHYILSGVDDSRWKHMQTQSKRLAPGYLAASS